MQAAANGLSGKRLLVIEDEKNITDILRFNIEKEGACCVCIYNGEDGLKEARKGGFDLILLDLMLPGLDGFEVCRRVREDSNVPIIMVTAREEEVDKVLGLEVGADDYITKPFSIKELVARIKSTLRRSALEQSPPTLAQENATLTIGALSFDTSKYEVRKAGGLLKLSKLEYELLYHMAKNKGSVFSREQLLEQVWGYDDFYGDLRTVDVTVRRLRAKLEDDAANPCYIMNKRGVGYYFDGGNGNAGEGEAAADRA
ncbi:MAG: response regulator [Eubacteriales bacterium]